MLVLPVRRVLLRLFLTFFIIAGSTQAIDVLGTVTDASTGVPLSNATVIITETSDTAVTDALGNYFFVNIPVGTYTLMVGRQNYTPLMMPGTSISLSCCIGISGNIDGDPGEIIDIGDLTALISYLFIPPNTPPVCMREGNIDGDAGGVVDIGDLTALISYLFIPPNRQPSPCQ